MKSTDFLVLLKVFDKIVLKIFDEIVLKNSNFKSSDSITIEQYRSSKLEVLIKNSF